VLSGEDFGITVSNHTYAIDDLGPSIFAVSPDSAEIFDRDHAIVVEASYMDDGGVLIAANPGGEGSTMRIAPTRASRTTARDSRTLDEPTSGDRPTTRAIGVGSDRPGERGISSGILPNDGDMAHLDDVGSGIDSAKVKIIRPDGSFDIPEVGDYYEWYNDHVKYTVRPPHIPGWYTINVTAWDCIGNNSTISWPFFVTPQAPRVEFLADTGNCRYNGFWNPDIPLTVMAEIEELQGININSEGIHLNIYRIYNYSDSGNVEELLVPDAAYSLTPQPIDGDVAQTFTLTATPSLDPDPSDIGIRFELVVVDVFGTAATMSKTYQIDRMAPWINILSPAPVVPEGERVTIHAVFSDDPPTAIATAPGSDRSRLSAPSACSTLRVRVGQLLVHRVREPSLRVASVTGQQS
jgi:hypothetical protein